MSYCIICNKKLSKGAFNLKDKFELFGHTFICKECAEKIGIKWAFSAGLYTAKRARKKYEELYPNENPEYKKWNVVRSNFQFSEEYKKIIIEGIEVKFESIVSCELIEDNQTVYKTVNDGFSWKTSKIKGKSNKKIKANARSYGFNTNTATTESNEYCTNMTIEIKINDINNPFISLEIISPIIKPSKSSELYIRSREEAQKIISILEIIINNNKND